MRLQLRYLLGLLVVAWVSHRAMAEGALEPYEGLIEAAAITELPDLKGRTHRLRDHEGSVVLVNFWATWCSPCLSEMPGMQRLADTFSGRRFKILAINSSEPRNRIESMLQRLQVDFTVLMDSDGGAISAWDVKMLPTSFIADRAGKIRYRVIGPFDWDGDEAKEVIEELLRDDGSGEGGNADD